MAFLIDYTQLKNADEIVLKITSYIKKEENMNCSIDPKEPLACQRINEDSLVIVNDINISTIKSTNDAIAYLAYSNEKTHFLALSTVAFRELMESKKTLLVFSRRVILHTCSIGSKSGEYGGTRITARQRRDCRSTSTKII